MTKTNLFDALEISLQALDHGADLESCLALFPELADDLRPVLVAAYQARSSAVLDVPADVMRRGKERFMQAAAEMREQSAPAIQPAKAPVSKGSFSPRFFRLAFTTAAMLAFLLSGGTGLVNASSASLPGDQLYPVKRSIEDVRLFFVFDPKAKAELEDHYISERVHEINELYSENRIAEVDFHGVVISRDNDAWVIGGLKIMVDSDLVVSDGIVPGSIVRVVGLTDDGSIEAEEIILVSAPSETPTSASQPTSQPEASRTPEATESSAADVDRKPTEALSSENEQQVTESETEQPEQISPNEQETQKPEENKPEEVESEQPENEKPEKPEEEQKQEETKNEESGEENESESPES